MLEKLPNNKALKSTREVGKMKDQLDVTCYILFHFYVLNMFRTLIYPSSGACDCVDELPHRSSCSVKTDDLASDIKLVFHSSTITIMHGPINIRIYKRGSRWMKTWGTAGWSLSHYMRLYASPTFGGGG